MRTSSVLPTGTMMAPVRLAPLTETTRCACASPIALAARCSAAIASMAAARVARGRLPPAPRPASCGPVLMPPPPGRDIVPLSDRSRFLSPPSDALFPSATPRPYLDLRLCRCECMVVRRLRSAPLYSSFFPPRTTEIVENVDLSGAPVSAFGRSPSVMRRVIRGAASPALRSTSDSVPTVAASASFCAAVGSTSSVTALATAGLSARSSATLIDRQHAHVLQHHVGACACPCPSGASARHRHGRRAARSRRRRRRR